MIDALPASTCDGCGTPIEQSRSNRRRRWCSERCRKQTMYGSACESCGNPTNGSNGRGPNAARLCVACSRAQQSTDAHWTRERCIAEGHRWRDLTGRWPLCGDWNRHQNRGERRTLIDRYHELTGPWPYLFVVQRRFGSWRAYVAALGGEAYPIGDGGRGRSRHARTAEMRALVATAEQAAC